MQEEELYDVLDLEADERFTQLDNMVEEVVEGVFEGRAGIVESYNKFNDASKDIFPLIAKDPVIGKKFLVDRAHTIMLLSILEKLGKIERKK